MFGFLKALARNSDPITSDEAAEVVQPHLEHLERSIVKMLRYWPSGLTTQELASSMNVARDSISPRMVKLEAKHQILRDGTRRMYGSRCKTTVWKATQEGTGHAQE